MYTLLKPLQVRRQLLEHDIRLFTPQEFGRLFRTPVYTTKYFLEEETKRGLFVRLKRGLYALQTDLPSEEEIANRLYTPSYVSLEYALAYYGLLPEMPYQVTSVTTKPTRLFTVNDHVFSYQTIKPEAYTGYHLVVVNEKRFLIAEPEKAVVDYFYFVLLGKKPLNERLQVSNVNKTKLFSYARMYERNRLLPFIKDHI